MVGSRRTSSGPRRRSAHQGAWRWERSNRQNNKSGKAPGSRLPTGHHNHPRDVHSWQTTTATRVDGMGENMMVDGIASGVPRTLQEQNDAWDEMNRSGVIQWWAMGLSMCIRCRLYIGNQACPICDEPECVPGIQCTESDGCVMAMHHDPPCRVEAPTPCTSCGVMPWEACKS